MKDENETEMDIVKTQQTSKPRNGETEMKRSTKFLGLALIASFANGCTLLPAIRQIKQDRLTDKQEYEACAPAEDVYGKLYRGTKNETAPEPPNDLEEDGQGGVLGSSVAYARIGDCEDGRGPFRLLALASEPVLRGQVMNLSAGQPFFMKGGSIDVFGQPEYTGSYFLVTKISTTGIESDPLEQGRALLKALGVPIPGEDGI